LAYSRPIFSTDSSTLVSRSTNDTGSYQLHSINSAAPPRDAFLPGQPLALTGNEGELLSVAKGFQLNRVHLPDSGKLDAVILVHEPDELPPTFWNASPEGGYVAGLAPDGTLSLWNAQTEKRVHKLTVPGVTPLAIHLSPDRRWIAITAGEQGFWLCSLTDESIRHLTEHLDQGKFAAFSPNSRLLATVSVDATIKLWDVASARVVGTLRGHRTEASTVAFAPDGRSLAVMMSGSGVRVLNAP
jgi:WD40 repeat protein